MDLMKELKKQANDILKDDKKKEKVGDTIEGLLKEAKKHVKDKNTKDGIDKIITSVIRQLQAKRKRRIINIESFFFLIFFVF